MWNLRPQPTPLRRIVSITRQHNYQRKRRLDKWQEAGGWRWNINNNIEHRIWNPITCPHVCTSKATVGYVSLAPDRAVCRRLRIARDYVASHGRVSHQAWRTWKSRPNSGPQISPKRIIIVIFIYYNFFFFGGSLIIADRLFSCLHINSDVPVPKLPESQVSSIVKWDPHGS